MIIEFLNQPLLGVVSVVRSSEVLLEHLKLPSDRPLYPGLGNCIQRLDVGIGVDSKALWGNVERHEMTLIDHNPPEHTRRRKLGLNENEDLNGAYRKPPVVSRIQH